MRFLNVGQGDATLITTPEGKQVLIDGGDDNGYAAYDLDSLDVDTLALVIASHAHADHIGGLADILRTTAVEAYVDNGVPAPTQAYGSVSALLTAHPIQYLQAVPRTIAVGSVTFRILPLPPGRQSQNNSSVGVLLAFGSFTALFTGDAEGKERKYWEEHVGLPPVTVLKVSHHGARNGTDTRWLEAVSPRMAVISVGAGNSYGHPDPKTARLLQQRGVLMYRTDRDGTVTVTADSTGTVTVRAQARDSVVVFTPAISTP